MTATLPADLTSTTLPHVFDRPDSPTGQSSHEQVVFCQDDATGLRAIIAIHSTTLGPALGGTRCYPYASESAALTDVLRLSRGMTYKAAVAGVELGGGKAVIIGDPTAVKTPDMLRAYGRFVERLGGRYITAGDVGTNSNDLDVIGEVTDNVVGRNTTAGGSGDSGPQTALGVFQSMRAAAAAVWGTPTLAGRTVGVEGAGKVGSALVSLLVADGAIVLVSDVDPAVAARAAAHPRATVVDSVVAHELDVYAPCALGATLHEQSVAALSAEIVCGAANNQLLTPDVEQLLRDRGIVWVPDYVANAGGLIQVEGERRGLSAEAVRVKIDAVYDTVASIFELAKRDSVLLGEAADRIAEERIAAAR
ncbi:MAG TPA: Glu/Leu/Phe/Val dehydrogenase dimerization domain-containing protein [Aldersonia sp.]